MEIGVYSGGTLPLPEPSWKNTCSSNRVGPRKQASLCLIAQGRLFFICKESDEAKFLMLL